MKRSYILAVCALAILAMAGCSGNTGSAEYENETSVIEQDAGTKGYADNFEVDSQAAAEFAKLIKAAVSAKDMEELAGLMGFPVYVGAAGGGVESKEEFLSLGEELIFTDELTDSVLSADTGDLKPSEAGFVLSDGGSANIIFGVRDGKLMISGINY